MQPGNWKPLNAELYRMLRQHFGEVKVEKHGQKLVRREGAILPGDKDILATGETYRVNCPVCGDGKKHLYISYAFGQSDPVTGQRIYMAICYRHGPVVEYLRSILEWCSMPRKVAVYADVTDTNGYGQDPYISPGTCVTLTDPAAAAGHDYLKNRGIDPVEASRVYGVSFCVEGNPECYNGAMAGRLVLPVFRDGQAAGWQCRLAFDPPVFVKDKNFANLRWVSMPGSGWRSTNLIGLDAARAYDYCIVVEGPTDMLKQGPPCVGTLGQTVSSFQVDLIAETWGKRKAVIVAGDSQKNQEDATSFTTATLLAQKCSCPVYLPRLPHGDPGGWERPDFKKFLAQHIRENLKGLHRGAGQQRLFMTTDPSGTVNDIE